MTSLPPRCCRGGMRCQRHITKTMSNTHTATGTGATAVQNVNIHDPVWQTDRKTVITKSLNVFGPKVTTVAWVKHNGAWGWWRVKLSVDRYSPLVTNYRVIDSKGNPAHKTAKPYSHATHKGIILPGEWSHKSARAAAEMVDHFPVGIVREEFIRDLVINRQTMTVKVSMTVTVKLTPGMLAYATREEVAEDIREMAREGAAYRFNATGHTATVN